MVCGMMSFRGLSDLHIVPRGKTVTSNFYVEEVLKGTATSAIRRRTEKWASNSRQTSARHVAGHFSAGRSPSSHRRQDPALVPGQLPCLLGERGMAGQQPRPIAHRKPLGDRPGQGRQDGPSDVRSVIEKRPLGQAQHLGRGAGQPDEWDAGAHEGLCVEAWRFHQQINHGYVFLCFLVTARS